MRVNKIFITFIFILISSCGFKIAQMENVDFFVNDITSKGDKIINYHLKNNLFFQFKDKIGQPVDLKINTNKTKNVKEKNIKNEITKYQITINVKINVKEIDADKLYKFELSKSGDFSVESQYSQTLMNEKQLIKLLAEDLSESILDELSFKLNDI